MLTATQVAPSDVVLVEGGDFFCLTCWKHSGALGSMLSNFDLDEYQVGLEVIENVEGHESCACLGPIYCGNCDAILADAYDDVYGHQEITGTYDTRGEK